MSNVNPSCRVAAYSLPSSHGFLLFGAPASALLPCAQRVCVLCALRGRGLAQTKAAQPPVQAQAFLFCFSL